MFAYMEPYREIFYPFSEAQKLLRPAVRQAADSLIAPLGRAAERAPAEGLSPLPRSQGAVGHEGPQRHRAIGTTHGHAHHASVLLRKHHSCWGVEWPLNGPLGEWSNSFSGFDEFAVTDCFFLRGTGSSG